MDKEIKTRLGLRIVELRKQHDIGMEELAEQLGFPIAYMALIERGMRLPDVMELREIAAILKTSIDFLVNE